MIKKLSYAEAVEKANCKSFRRQAELEKQYECALKDWSKIAKHLPNPASAERDISRAYKFSFGFFTLVAGIPEGVWKMLWLDKRNEIAAGFQDLNNVSHADSLSTGMNCNIFAEALAGSYIKLRDPKASLACYFESAMFLKGWRSVGHRSMEKFTPPLRKIEHALILNIPKEYFSKSDNPFCSLWNEFADGKKKASLPYDRLVKRMRDYASKASSEWKQGCLLKTFTVASLKDLYKKDVP